jgi:hypothetical protein
MHEWTGVWLSDSPLDEQSGGESGDAISVQIPDEIIEPYEWVDEHGGYREFLVPAEILNRYARTVIRDWNEDAL